MLGLNSNWNQVNFRYILLGDHCYGLGLFDKIKETIEEVPHSRTVVCRALVMDGASNSVKTLRAFASQDEYHYITPL